VSGSLRIVVKKV